METTKINIRQLYKGLLGLIPSDGLSMLTVDRDEETGQSFESSETWGPWVAVREIFNHATWRGETDLERLSEIKSLGDIKDLLEDALSGQGVGLLFIGSKADLLKAKADKERQRLERTASQIASRHGVRVDSFEFIKVLEARAEAEQVYREGLREDGLCIGYGVSPEQWHEEVSYSQSETASVSDLLAFLSTYCPLLMAQYRESKLQEVSLD